MNTPCLKHYKELNSTNSYVLDNFDNLKTGDVVVTDVQTSGRGRFDRVWEGSSSENIYMTFVIKPENTDSFPFVNLTQYLSVILNRVLNRDFGVKSNIKWPNDLLFEGKKISGILAEVKTSLGKMQGVALGVGINVNCDMSKFKELPNATSISSILGHSVNKKDLLNLVVEEFFKDFEEFSKQGFVFISDEYKKMCKFNDTVKISASSNNGEFKFDALNDDGTLSVLDENNKKITIVNGDILC